AGSLAGGLREYTGGVDSLAFGLSQLEVGAAQLGGLSSGVSQYTSGISQLSAGLSAVNPGVQFNPGVDPAVKAGLQQIVDGLAAAAVGGQTLSAETSSGIADFRSGVSQSVGGAYQLADGSPALVSGADALAAGAGELASGLRDGAAQLPKSDADTIERTLEVVADPVGVSVTTDNAVTEVAQVVATFVVPLGLWVGAFAAFLVLPRLSRRAMASTASGARLTAAVFGRAALVTSASAMLLVVVLHTAIGLSISLLPATVLFSLVMAIAFTAVHCALTVALGRAGMVVSLLLLAVQVTSTGGVYPIELVSAPFRLISPFLPLTYGVDGMQAIIAGGVPGTALSAGVVLVFFGAVSMIVASLALRQRRKAGALGLVPIGV
ncbi:MAG: YhgE/Pip family protein, partial [Salinibacterium sp.]|nr:YhgE/Pip family protein [Salinibacterium sp.]